MNKAHKRFIAGAVCPRCGELDKIFIYRVADRDFRECVNCDFKEEQQFPAIPREPDTRINGRDEALEQAVRFVEPILIDPAKRG